MLCLLDTFLVGCCGFVFWLCLHILIVVYYGFVLVVYVLDRLLFLGCFGLVFTVAGVVSCFVWVSVSWVGWFVCWWLVLIFVCFGDWLVGGFLGIVFRFCSFVRFGLLFSIGVGLLGFRLLD